MTTKSGEGKVSLSPRGRRGRGFALHFDFQICCRAMARLACQCLNVSVFVNKSDWKSNPVPTAKLFSEQCSVTSDVVYEVDLDVAGIVVVSMKGCGWRGMVSRPIGLQ